MLKKIKISRFVLLKLGGWDTICVRAFLAMQPLALISMTIYLWVPPQKGVGFVYGGTSCLDIVALQKSG